MAKLTERYVQYCALNYLKSYYEAQNPNKAIYARTEMATIYNKKQGRADGLLAFKNHNGYIYTVSLEAKSHKTFSSLRNFPLDNRLLLSLGLSFLLFVVASWFALGTTIWWLKLIIAILISLVISFGLISVFMKRNMFDTHRIIEQVKRYPADEKWIAISSDAFNLSNKNESGLLLSKAQSEGIGVLIVSSGNKVKIKLRPKKPKLSGFKSSYIYKYKIHKTIIRHLDSNS